MCQSATKIDNIRTELERNKEKLSCYGPEISKIKPKKMKKELLKAYKSYIIPKKSRKVSKRIKNS